jgi:hypothetical protein
MSYAMKDHPPTPSVSQRHNNENYLQKWVHVAATVCSQQGNSPAPAQRTGPIVDGRQDEGDDLQIAGNIHKL